MSKNIIIASLLLTGITFSPLSAMNLGDAAAMLPGQTGQNSSTVAAVADAIGSSDLTNLLVKQLGVTQTQANGGAGSILNYAKESLSVEDFAKVAGAVPGIDSLLGAVPSAGGALGGVATALGGGSLGGMATIASQFSSLGLDANMVQQFTPIILEYVNGTGGADVMNLLGGLFK